MKHILVATVLGLLALVGMRRLARQTVPPVPMPNGGSVIGDVSRGVRDTSNPFGLMFTNINYVSLAKKMGVKYYRPLGISTGSWNGVCAECDAAVNNGLKLVLTVKNNDSSLDLFKQHLGKILDKYKPVVVAIENEENSQLFYTGTPSEYLAELRAGCAAAHAKGIKCTNGGIVSELAVLMVANDMVNRGQITEANNYLQTTIGSKLQGLLGQRNMSAERLLKLPKAVEQINKGKELLLGYEAAGADYFNFHWYVADPASLATAKNYLESFTGLPAITNEVGQQGNTDPSEVTAVMQKIVELKLPVAVWFSVDVNAYGGAKSLLDGSGNLRPNGVAFKTFLSS